MLSDLKLTTLAAIASLGACVAATAADATGPIDYTSRNETLAPVERVPLPKQKPAGNGAVQEKRVEPPMIDKRRAPIEGREAAVELGETREKRVREKALYPVDVREQPTSAFNHRPAAIATSADAIRPPMVAKYQESLTAASAANMARFPAVGRATSTKINRFIFRRNPAERETALKENQAIPAAGGSALER